MIDKDDKALLTRLGLKVKELRNQRQYTLRDLEAHSGIDNSNLSKIENGKKQIALTTLIKICAGLDVSVVDLLREIGL